MAFGERISCMLVQGVPVRAEFCPGNGTRYDLVFVPAAATEQLFSGPPLVEWAGDNVFVSLVDWKGSKSYPFRLDHQIHPSYVAEHLAINETDAHAVNCLFGAIAGVAPAEWWSTLEKARVS